MFYLVFIGMLYFTSICVAMLKYSDYNIISIHVLIFKGVIWPYFFCKNILKYIKNNTIIKDCIEEIKK
jgi:hypothetical protein